MRRHVVSGVDRTPLPPPVDRPRVVHVIPALALGGAEAIVAALAIGRHRRGWPTEVVALLPTGSPDPHDFVEGLRAEGVPTLAVRSSRRGYWTEGLALRRRSRPGPVIVHSHKFRSNVASLFGRGAESTLVATVHGYARSGGRSLAYQWMDRLLLRRFDAVIGVSRSLCGQLVASGVPADRTHLIYNAPPPPMTLTRSAARRRLGLHDRGSVIGWIGRLSEEKGPDLLVEAMQLLDDESASVAVIGDGPMRARVESEIVRRGLSGRVALLGALPRAAELLPAFDALVVSSRQEGFPTVILEAMAAGVPVVAFAVGGIPELLDSTSALLVPSGETASLAAAIRECLADPVGARARAMRGRIVSAERIDLDRWLDDIEDVYRVARAPAGR